MGWGVDGSCWGGRWGGGGGGGEDGRLAVPRTAKFLNSATGRTGRRVGGNSVTLRQTLATNHVRPRKAIACQTSCRTERG